MLNVSYGVGADCAVVELLSLAVTRQYHVPIGRAWVQLVPACQPELYDTGAKLVLALSST